MNPLLDSAQQLTAVNFLEYEIKFLFVFEELDQLDDVRMALTMMERLDLFEYARPCMPGNFVDNFNSVLQVGIKRPTGLNRGVGTFSKNFAGQPVQFWNKRDKSYIKTTIWKPACALSLFLFQTSRSAFVKSDQNDSGKPVNPKIIVAEVTHAKRSKFRISMHLLLFAWVVYFNRISRTIFFPKSSKIQKEGHLVDVSHVSSILYNCFPYM